MPVSVVAAVTPSEGSLHVTVRVRFIQLRSLAQQIAPEATQRTRRLFTLVFILVRDEILFGI